jgi:hypothetical protein
MSRNAKIGISVVIGIVVVCLCVCGGGFAAVAFAGDRLVENMFVEDPVRARRAAAEMLDYELPEGFTESAMIDFFYGSMVMIEGARSPAGDPGVIILLAQVDDPSLADSEQFRQGFDQGMQQSVEWTYSDQDVITLAGQDVYVSTFEGAGSSGQTMRQLSTDTFFGKSGMVFLSITGPVDGWPQNEIDAFLASIR